VTQNDHEARRLTFIVPGDPDQRTGGYLYDAHIVAGLRSLGWQVQVIGLEGRFPCADAVARQAMGRALDCLPERQCVVIDGLALGGVPDSVRPHADRLALIGLVHHPLADETGLSADRQAAFLVSERAALQCCRSVIVTSPFTRRRLDELALAGDRPIHVIEPGARAAELAQRVGERLHGTAPESPARLLCVGHLSRRKGQNLLIDALADLTDLDWQLDLVGSADRDPAFARELLEGIERHGLKERVHLHGEVDGEQLVRFYSQAHVCLLPSWYEGYGMVVTEALARGLPLISSTGGALRDTVPESAALRFPPGDVDALREALARWLTDADLQRRLCRAAVEERAGLTDWSAAVQRFAEAAESTLAVEP
jgi:glycosyltransferase involved in cell wall biosynthesis